MFRRTATMVFALAISVTVIIIYANVSEAEVVTDGLVSYWSFDGGSLADAVGGHDGAFVGDAVVVPGKFGDALEFDGSGSCYVEMADPDAFTCNADFTWCAWIRTGDGGCIIAKTEPVIDSDVQGAKTLFVGEGVLTMDTGWVGGARGTVTVNDAAWHYVAMTVEFNGDDTIQFYIDGEDGGQGSMNVDEFPEDGFAVTIGWDPRCGMEFAPFAGIIDDVSVYSRALSADEIRQNFEAGAMGSVSPVDPAEKLASTWGGMKALAIFRR